MKTEELSGAALDWAVAKALAEYKPVAVPPYSTSWSIAGPIIEREGISLLWMEFIDEQYWVANITGDKYEYEERSKNPIEAAMRVYVASKLGDEVQLPEGVYEQQRHS